MIHKILATLTLSFALALPISASAQSFGVDYNEAASAILSARADAAKVRSLKAVPSLGVIRVANGSTTRLSSIDENITTLIISSERNHANIAQLRSALMANPVTKQALLGHGVAVGQIIGIRVGSNGSLRIFVI